MSDKHTWNHRVIKRTHPSGAIEYGIHEVFYENGKIWAATEDAVSVTGESVDELRETLGWMLKAIKNPVINFEDLPKDVEGGK